MADLALANLGLPLLLAVVRHRSLTSLDLPGLRPPIPHLAVLLPRVPAERLKFLSDMVCVSLLGPTNA